MAYIVEIRLRRQMQLGDELFAVVADQMIPLYDATSYMFSVSETKGRAPPDKCGIVAKFGSFDVASSIVVYPGL